MLKSNLLFCLQRSVQKKWLTNTLCAQFFLFLFFGFFVLAGCASKDPEPSSLKEVYELALRESEIEVNSTTSIEKLKNIATQFEGTRYAGLAQLRLAEILNEQLNTAFNKAEDFEAITFYYKLFLTQNPQHHLSPYLINRLLEVAYLKSIAGIFVVGTDPSPYEQMITEAQNFLLLYPQNVYHKDVLFYYAYAQEKLAQYEVQVGDYYFNNDFFSAAANRYQYVLQHFPQYNQKKALSQKLINALIKNQQPEQAQQLQESYKILYGEDVLKEN